MAVCGSSRSFLGFFALFSLIFLVFSPSSRAQAPAPTSDGTSIDQGIAYVLMLVALVLTYLIHTLDASASIEFAFTTLET
ncbi:hypothetical protein P3X46_003630 [Hevea brasiliensis]|uniref:Uncharacterized protein n=1 Tax=Hevea brasiliensis TaxID=3981 RepID=A0ABQ9NA50_HEVBR|nr:arabinogalactan protein 41-like [Hevea brasiliensis]KAJ9188258.1 hypothetical protein P3X46_003630 [Hevea brasiliensis]